MNLKIYATSLIMSSSGEGMLKKVEFKIQYLAYVYSKVFRSDSRNSVATKMDLFVIIAPTIC